ncbi:ribosomal protein L7/L12 [Planomicrobium stackebrandtii]|uniref:Ribosomal protein L7/L12 n=1 Tax=Planomicrobium stackebrandtii TaxID=253160 RepID=A0ABU0GR50_9BACL|nr:hypothetical protein [Planomicrobium stackebrandtii]MDQ0427831.1 ribosomal protein L7/L12 [Planomicrobium stackebrandtii]
MDLSWILIIIGAVLVFGYVFYNATEQRVKALETRIRHVEKLLQHATQGQKITEPDINEELRELLQKGRMVEAVKRTRQEFGWSLLEAKQYVDELKAGK